MEDILYYIKYHLFYKKLIGKVVSLTYKSNDWTVGQLCDKHNLIISSIQDEYDLFITYDVTKRITSTMKIEVHSIKSLKKASVADLMLWKLKLEET